MDSFWSTLQALAPGRQPVPIRVPIDVNMPIAELWSLLSNTQRMNPAAGFPPIDFQVVEGQVGQQARARFLGIPFRWMEMPFEWVEEREFSVERLFDVMAERVTVGARFTAVADERTTVEVIGEVVPRNYLARLMSVLVLDKVMGARFRQLCRTFETNYRERKKILFPPPSKPEVNLERLHSLAATLRATPGIEPAILELLVDHLRLAADEEVNRMRPFALADRWQVSRDEVLDLFLHATRAGLLDLQWEIVCPNCRVTKASYSTLAELKQQAHCETCHINFDATFDQYVELRFTANPRVRTAASNVFCIGGPFMTPHIKAQARIPAGASRDIALPLPPGSYRIRCRGLPERVHLLLVDRDAPDSASLAITESGPRGERITLRASDSDFLTVTNSGPKEAVIIIEQDAWDQNGVSAAMVTSLQRFRDLFSSEVLAPGMGIEIRTLTFLFSDLRNSTVLYEEDGDSPAYSLVRDHFVALTTAISQHQGALVKTIGDAVMAVFSDPAEALRAAIESQEAIARLNQAAPSRTPLVLKLGLHLGPCIAITANNTIDYFGSTVNAAARAQGKSLGGDIILTEALAMEPDVAEMLQRYERVEQFSATLKGLTPRFTLYRLWPLPEIWTPVDGAAPLESATSGGNSPAVPI